MRFNPDDIRQVGLSGIVLDFVSDERQLGLMGHQNCFFFVLILIKTFNIPDYIFILTI